MKEQMQIYVEGRFIIAFNEPGFHFYGPIYSFQLYAIDSGLAVSLDVEFSTDFGLIP